MGLELPEDGLPDETQSQIEKIGGDFLHLLESGQSPDLKEFVELHPELAPELENRLKLLEAVFRAMRRSTSQSRPSASEGASQVDKSSVATFIRGAKKTIAHWNNEYTLRINCPHCGNLIQIVQQESREVICDSCGSSVQLDQDATQSLSTTQHPQTIGRFTVQRLLGRGGFGSVYLAQDQLLDRKVAVKVPRQGFFQTQEEEQRFFREAKNAAGLTHANIVQVHDVSQQDQTPYIVSEFIDGLTLGDLISGKKLNFTQIAELMVQICDAVQYAHENGIVHRDLKPSNIMVDYSGRPYVTDFGLARRDEPEITITHDGMIIGTPAYMSPEQASGDHDRVDARSDVYSLGVILYQLLSRELPFAGSKRMLLYQVLHEEPKKLQRLDESIPLDLETMTLKAMSKKPSERYESAKAFGDEFRRWLKGEPILARPISSLLRCWRLCRRYPAVSTLASALVFLLLAGTVVALVVASHEAKIATMAAEKERLAQSRLYKIVRQNGLNHLEENDLFRAGYWFSRALEFDDGQVNRIRVGMTMDQLPKLTRLWHIGSQANVISFTTTGDKLACGTSDGRVHIFDLLTKKSIFETKVQVGGIFKLVFLKDGNYVAFKAGTASVQIWDIHNAKLVSEVRHTSTITSITTNTSGEILATASDDSSVRFWNSTDGSLISEEKFSGAIRELQFVPNTSFVLVNAMLLNGTLKDFDAATSKVYLWDVGSRATVAVQELEYPVQLNLASDGKKFLTLAGSNSIRVWSTVTGAQIGETVTCHVPLRSAFFDTKNEAIITLDSHSTLSRWDVAAKKVANEINLGFRPDKIAINPARMLVAASSNDGMTHILGSETGIEVCSRLPCPSGVSNLAFHPSGRELAIASGEGVLQIWDISGSVPAIKVLPHQDSVRNAHITPNSKRCLTSSMDGSASMWNVKDGQRLGSPMAHDAAIVDSLLDASGQLFLTISSDKTARVWDSASTKPFGATLMHDSEVVEIAASPDVELAIEKGTGLAAEKGTGR